MNETIRSGREIWFEDAAATFRIPADKVLQPETMENAYAVLGDSTGTPPAHRRVSTPGLPQ